MVKDQYPVKIAQGGYSEPILQPCYVVGIGTIFLLAPYLGWLLSTFIVAAPALYIAVKIAKKQEERDEVIRKIVWDKLNLYLSIYDVSNLLRANRSELTPEVLEQGLNMSRGDANRLFSELLKASLVTNATKPKLQVENLEKARSVTPRLTQTAKA